MDIIHAVILGVVEGVSEFLPISSTGHLILTSRLLGIPETEFGKTFNIAIQLGAILSVVVLFGKSLLLDIKVLQRVIVAFIPTAIIGLTFYDLIKKHLLGSSMVVAWSLLIGGVLLIVFELLHKEKDDARSELRTMPFKTAMMIGLFQSVAMIPGVSRSAATIIGGLVLGLKRRTIVEFSFLLAVPTMMAAAGLDLLKSASSFTASETQALVVGFIVSFIVALASIKFLLHFIKTNSFIPFGIYRIIVGIVFIFFGSKD